jgi:ubiquitin-protein ligase
MAKIFKRIFKDIQEIKTGDLHTHGIYCSFSDKNIHNAYALIIGPDDTPYSDGSYIFKIEFPSNYPLSPPKVISLTQGHYIRFNPNLYTNGKVCVSILNTWVGPEWTTSCTLQSVLLSIQTLLNETPIHNEPGWETIESTDLRCVNYNNLLKYANLKIAILDMIDKSVGCLEVFKDIMLEHLHKVEFKLKEYIDQNINHDKLLKTEIYTLNIKTDYKNCLYRLNEFLKIPIIQANIDALMPIKKEIETETEKSKKELEETQIENQDIEGVEIIANKQLTIKNKHVIRKAPKENSKIFDVGYEKISENDGKLYVVYLTPNNNKRWKLKNV